VMREQLEQVRRLAEALESSAGRKADPPVLSSLPGPETVTGAEAEAEAHKARAGHELREIQSVVTERLAALERERQSGWQKILRTITGL
jgi:hypothetical protein